MGGAWPEVVILGGGFAGLAAARVLERARVPYLLVDARNHHLFQPLLYQVATGFLEGPAIAYPLRALVRRGRVLLARARAVDLEDRRLLLEMFFPTATSSWPPEASRAI
ncbi:hypothetical protein TthTF19_22560 (plasmid) [Thermus thermophilus]